MYAIVETKNAITTEMKTEADLCRWIDNIPVKGILSKTKLKNKELVKTELMALLPLLLKFLEKNKTKVRTLSECYDNPDICKLVLDTNEYEEWDFSEEVPRDILDFAGNILISLVARNAVPKRVYTAKTGYYRKSIWIRNFTLATAIIYRRKLSVEEM